ncbi:hypothetical protein [Hyperthermus butylicus]|uniref:hypothetical protein n=1 Tax=Hyperthermus butylicus TaxID=54248 RepID=UPI0003248DDB|nr:hypothetical protein [Hyperthermus butylicus]
MPCPWYRGGLCTSPKLSEPTTAVTSPERCLGGEAEYKSCKFYVEPSSQQRSRPVLEASLKPAIEKQLRPYKPIHLITHRPRSGCPFFKVYEYAGGYLVVCQVLNRLLTKSEATKCEKYWQTCPFYRLGMQQKQG